MSFGNEKWTVTFDDSGNPISIGVTHVAASLGTEYPTSVFPMGQELVYSIAGGTTTYYTFTIKTESDRVVDPVPVNVDVWLTQTIITVVNGVDRGVTGGNTYYFHQMVSPGAQTINWLGTPPPGLASWTR